MSGAVTAPGQPNANLPGLNTPVIELDAVCKHFGSTLALSDMSIRILPAKVHAIVGENGAGKSTMIKIMTGVYQPDEGSIKMDGAPRAISGTQMAREHGIVAIYQEPMVFSDLDVAENIFISSTAEGWFQNNRNLRRKAHALLERIGIRLDVDRIASGLTLAEQQAVEIARALSQDVRVLIMDEPTASLSAYEAAQLRKTARALADDGMAIVYISHRLEEIFEVADSVSVIRDGRHISTRAVTDTNADLMITEMVGREVGNYFSKAPSRAQSETVLEVRALTRTGVFSGVDFDLHRGEILCMAGLIGARRTDVALALFGVEPATSGSISWMGKQGKFNSARQAMDAGIAYVSEDRRKFGLAMSMPIRANVTLATLQDFLSRIGLINRVLEATVTNAFRQRLNIRAADIEMDVGMLSGGNQQKVMLAKWLNMRPKLLIFDEPTRGIDIGAKAEVHDLIRTFVEEGGSALVISSDLPEVLALGDRILVMREGRQMAIVDNDDADQASIMALATGRSSQQEAG